MTLMSAKALPRMIMALMSHGDRCGVKALTSNYFAAEMKTGARTETLLVQVTDLHAAYGVAGLHGVRDAQAHQLVEELAAKGYVAAASC